MTALLVFVSIRYAWCWYRVGRRMNFVCTAKQSDTACVRTKKDDPCQKQWKRTNGSSNPIRTPTAKPPDARRSNFTVAYEISTNLANLWSQASGVVSCFCFMNCGSHCGTSASRVFERQSPVLYTDGREKPRIHAPRFVTRSNAASHWVLFALSGI